MSELGNWDANKVRAFLEFELPNICDAEPIDLAKYIIALLESEVYLKSYTCQF